MSTADRKPKQKSNRQHENVSIHVLRRFRSEWTGCPQKNLDDWGDIKCTAFYHTKGSCLPLPRAYDASHLNDVAYGQSARSRRGNSGCTACSVRQMLRLVAISTSTPDWQPGSEPEGSMLCSDSKHGASSSAQLH